MPSTHTYPASHGAAVGLVLPTGHWNPSAHGPVHAAEESPLTAPNRPAGHGACTPGQQPSMRGAVRHVAAASCVRWRGVGWGTSDDCKFKVHRTGETPWATAPSHPRHRTCPAHRRTAHCAGGEQSRGCPWSSCRCPHGAERPTQVGSTQLLPGGPTPAHHRCACACTRLPNMP